MVLIYNKTAYIIVAAVLFLSTSCAVFVEETRVEKSSPESTVFSLESESEEPFIDLVEAFSETGRLEFILDTNLEVFEFDFLKNGEMIESGNGSPNLSFEGLEKNTEYTLELYHEDFFVRYSKKTDDTVIIRFGGDTTMSEFFGDALDNYGVDYMWEDISSLTSKADFSFVNLETSVSKRGASTKPIGFGFRSKPSHLQGFVNAGIDMVILANNHVLDYGKDAFIDTMDHLAEYDIEYIGAGRDYREASSVKYFDIKGLRLGFFAASSIIPAGHWVADTQRGGIMPLRQDYYEEILDIVREAGEKCDYLFVLLHWGTEYVSYPSQSQRDLAHLIVDAGADVIVGTHPHVLQGVEYYNDAIIFYSIGNFVFYIHPDNPDSGLTGLFEIELCKDSIVSAGIYPVRINRLKANLLCGSDPIHQRIIDNLNERSSIFNTVVDPSGRISPAD